MRKNFLFSLGETRIDFSLSLHSRYFGSLIFHGNIFEVGSFLQDVAFVGVDGMRILNGGKILGSNKAMKVSPRVTAATFSANTSFLFFLFSFFTPRSPHYSPELAFTWTCFSVLYCTLFSSFSFIFFFFLLFFFTLLLHQMSQKGCMYLRESFYRQSLFYRFDTLLLQIVYTHPEKPENILVEISFSLCSVSRSCEISIVFAYHQYFP